MYLGNATSLANGFQVGAVVGDNGESEINTNPGEQRQDKAVALQTAEQIKKLLAITKTILTFEWQQPQKQTSRS